MAFSATNFIGATSPTDRIITLFDSVGSAVGGFSVCNYQKASTEGSQLWIVVPEGKISLDFPSEAQAKRALTLLTTVIESLLPNCVIIGGSGTTDPGTKKYIESTDNITVKAFRQYYIYGDLTVDGNLTNDIDGEVLIENGSMVIGAGTFTNNGTLVLADTIDEATVTSYTQPFTTVANTPLNIPHLLNSNNFVYSVFDTLGNPIGVTLIRIDSNNVTIETVVAVTGTINILAI